MTLCVPEVLEVLEFDGTVQHESYLILYTGRAANQHRLLLATALAATVLSELQRSNVSESLQLQSSWQTTHVETLVPQSSWPSYRKRSCLIMLILWSHHGAGHYGHVEAWKKTWKNERWSITVLPENPSQHRI